MLYEYIFAFYGHSLYIDKVCHENDSLQIKFENSIIVTVSAITDLKTKKTQRIKILGCYLYNAIVTTFIIWSIFYPVANIIINNGVFKYDTFQIVYLNQYIIGLWHYNNVSFVKNNMIKKINMMSVITLIFSMCFCILSVIFILKNVSINNDIWNYKMSNLMILILCLNRFYSYSAFFANMTFFFVQMHLNKKNLESFVFKLNKYIKNQDVLLIDKVNLITKDFLKNKNYYDESIENLNLFFSSFTAIGILSIYYTLSSIEVKNVDSIDFINISLFVAIELIYINIAQKIRSYINSIAQIVNMPIFYKNRDHQLSTYMFNDPDLKKKDIMRNITNLHEMSITIYVCCKEIEECILWSKLQETIKIECDTFQIFGLKISDTAILQKIFYIFMTIIFTKNVLQSLS